MLAHFGTTVGTARIAYREFVSTAGNLDLDLDGGGLRRSAAVWHYPPRTPRGRERWAHDERILGRPEFVRCALEGAPATPPKIEDALMEVAALCTRVAKHFGVLPTEISSPSLRRRALATRAVVCHLAVLSPRVVAHHRRTLLGTFQTECGPSPRTGHKAHRRQSPPDREPPSLIVGLHTQGSQAVTSSSRPTRPNVPKTRAGRRQAKGGRGDSPPPGRFSGREGHRRHHA